jgi:hypothetical protein
VTLSDEQGLLVRREVMGGTFRAAQAVIEAWQAQNA